MRFKLAIKVLALLSACMILNVSTVMAETESNYPYADIDDMKKESVSSSDSDKNLVRQNSTNTNASNQKKRSIKMIVGGQSEDGVAKQVTVSVDD